MTMLQETIHMMSEKLNPPILDENHAISAFTNKIEAAQKDILHKIEAFFQEKPEQQTLGAAWRGLGLVPPSSVTRLGV